MSLRLRELPRQDLPRERLARAGSAALADAELIAILLGTGKKGLNVLELAHQLLAQFGSLSAIARASVADLMKIPAVGPAKAAQIAAAFGLGQRLTAETISRTRIDRPDLVYGLLGSEMRRLSKESLRVILLDTKYHLIKIEDVALGSLNESIAHPREIFLPAIRHSAYAFIVVHNHPSGDPAPSDADHRLTRRLAEGASLLKINMLDHVIIGAPLAGGLPYFSFREAGIL